MVRRLTLAACLLGLAFPAAASADTYFSESHVARFLDVRANHIAWTLAADGDHERLRAGFAATLHNIPVPRAGSFGGLDLGSDRRGRTVLVYARCARPARRRCDLYLYRSRSGRERRLASVSRRACNETLPHVDRGVLLFRREPRSSRNPRKRCSGGLFLKRPGHRLRRVMRKAPRVYDFAGRLVAFEREATAVSEIRLLRVGRRRSRLVTRAEGSFGPSGREGVFLSSPRLDGGFVYWQRSLTGAREQDDILRRPVSGGATAALERAGRAWVGSAGSGGDDLLSFAVYRRRLLYLYGGVEGASGFSIGRVDPTPVFR